MKRAVIEYRDGFANIPADKIDLQEIPNGSKVVVLKNGPEIVGIFDLEIVQKCYISEKQQPERADG